MSETSLIDRSRWEPLGIQLYLGHSDNGYRLSISARLTAAGTPQAQWIVRFLRCSDCGKLLDQCAAWLPTMAAWDRRRWHPVGSHHVPPIVLEQVEAWLRQQGVPG